MRKQTTSMRECKVERESNRITKWNMMIECIAQHSEKVKMCAESRVQSGRSEGGAQFCDGRETRGQANIEVHDKIVLCASFIGCKFQVVVEAKGRQDSLPPRQRFWLLVLVLSYMLMSEMLCLCNP